MRPHVVEIAYASVDLNDLPAILRSHLRSPTVWYYRDDCTPFDGIERALRDAGYHRPRFVEAITELLISPDLSERSAACYLLRDICKDMGAARLNSILRDHPAYFVGVASNRYDAKIPDLEFAILESLAHVVQPTDLDAIYRLQDALYRHSDAGLLWTGLARVVPDWVVNHARRIPYDWAFRVVTSLPNSQLRARLIDVLSPWPAKIRDDIVQGKRMYGIGTTPVAEEVRSLLQYVSVVE